MTAYAAAGRQTASWPFAAACAALAAPAGALLALGLGPQLLALTVVAAAFLVGILDWRLSLIGLLVYLPVSGLLTIALYPRTAPGVLAKDFLFVLPAYAGFALGLLRRREPLHFKGAPTLLFAALAALVAVHAFNPALPEPLVGLIGLKVWLFYLPLFYLGYRLVATRAELDRLLTVIALGAILPAVVGIAEAILFVTGHQQIVYGFYGDAAAAATQSFAQLNIGGSAPLLRVPSTFSFVAQYYLFVSAMIAVTYAWWRGTRRGGVAGPALFALVVVAALTSGSRGAFVFVPFLVGMTLILDRVGARRIVTIAAGLAALLLAATVALGSNIGAVADAVVAQALTNASFIVDWIPDVAELTTTGLGAGIDTSAARYAFENQDPSVVFEEIGGVWLETWWIKAMLELGIAGLIVCAALLGTILVRALRGHLRLADPGLRSISAALVALMIWNIVYAIKAQYLDFDPMNVYFWLFAGLLVRIHALDRQT